MDDPEAGLQKKVRQETATDVKRLQDEAAARELELATQEWESTATIVPGLSGLHAEVPKQSALISFNEALQFFQTSNMQEQSKRTMPVVRRSGLAVLLHCLCGPPQLFRELVDERNLIFNIAACPLDNSALIHMRVLQTIYRQLTGDRFDCPRYGRHWEGIGFQGCDPATDLRGVGFWGLMNLLYMVTCPQTLPLAKDIYRLSLNEIQSFPFVVMSINVTAITMQMVREERLNRVCNSRRQVVAVVNEFYAGLFMHLYLRWKNEHKTIAHSGFVLKDVEAHARCKTKTVFGDLETHLKELETASSESRSGRRATRTSVPSCTAAASDFTDIYSVFPVADAENGHAFKPPIREQWNSTVSSEDGGRDEPVVVARTDTSRRAEEELFI